MKNVRWVVSPVTVNDLPAIFTIDNQSPSPWTMSQLEGELFNPHSLQLASRHPDDNRLVGFIMGRTIRDESEILRIATSSTDRRQGIACCMILEFIKMIKSKGACKCHLELRSANTPAQHLYEKFDFLVTGLRKNYYSYPTEDALCMSLSIT